MLYALALYWHWRTARRRNKPDPDGWPALATMLLSALGPRHNLHIPAKMYGPIITFDL